MIQIQLDETTKKKIMKLHWLWFWNRLIENKVRIKGKNVKIKSSYQFLYEKLGWKKSDFYKIVLGDYSELLELIKSNNEYKKKFDVFYKQKKDEYNILAWNVGKRDYGPNTTKKSLKDIVFDCFGYDDFRSGSFEFDKKMSNEVENWSAFSLVQELKLEVCPYCNKEYIPIVKKNNKFRAEIDHFFPQKMFPYLSCSLFNLIPSCLICNHHKGDSYNVYNNGKIKLIIHPYTEGFESFDSAGQIVKNAVFKALPGPDGIYKSKEVILKYKKAKLGSKIKNSNDAFLIEELHNTCLIELEDLLTRLRNYAKPKISNIIKMLAVDSNVKNKIDSLQIDTKAKKALINDIILSYHKSLRNEMLGIPLDDSGNSVNKEYPFRKFKIDIIEQIEKK